MQTLPPDGGIRIPDVTNQFIHIEIEVWVIMNTDGILILSWPGWEFRLRKAWTHSGQNWKTRASLPSRFLSPVSTSIRVQSFGLKGLSPGHHDASP
jgi:hypothetical protein